MNRVDWYTHTDILSIDTLDDLIKLNYVLIINAARASSLKKHYPSTQFHISEEKYMPTLGTYAVRFTLEKEFRKRLAKL